VDYAFAVVPGWHSSQLGILRLITYVLFALLISPLFILMTRAAMNDGGPVDKPNRVRQWYGYTVCLIAVITGLICVAGTLDNAFDLSNPLATDGPFGESLGSFDAYKATRDRRYFPSDQHAVPDTASDATLRARFEALRADRIAQRTFQARKGLVTDLILLLIAIGLFVTHWRWLRRLPEPEGPSRAA
jgi:hypothetical protein